MRVKINIEIEIGDHETEEVMGREGGGEERRRGAHVLFHGRAGWQPHRGDVGGSSHPSRTCL